MKSILIYTLIIIHSSLIAQGTKGYVLESSDGYITVGLNHTSDLSGDGTSGSPLGLSSTAFNSIAPSKTGNALKYLRVNAGETDFEFSAISGLGDAVTTNPLSQFASTNSSQLAGVISDETGTDKLVYSASPVLTGTPTAPTATLNSNTSQVATTAYVDSKIITAALTSDHAISSTSATPVGLTASLTTGTYVFTYYILAQSSNANVSPMFGINFSGTAAVKAFKLRYPDTGTAATTGTADDDGSTGGQIEGSDHETAYTTTAPNMGATGGVATINTNILYVIEGLLVVTASGTLELHHGSETATSTTFPSINTCT